MYAQAQERPKSPPQLKVNELDFPKVSPKAAEPFGPSKVMSQNDMLKGT